MYHFLALLFVFAVLVGLKYMVSAGWLSLEKLKQGAYVLGAALLMIVLIFAVQALMAGNFTFGSDFSTFTTIFLGIFIEAAPFLLLGTLASGVVEVFISKEAIQGRIPSNPFLGALTAGMMGFAFPVCECGVVPLTRRLFKKGLPPYIGITFLLASPIINPIVLASTVSAFGWGPVFWLRVGFSLMIAVGVGLVFSLQKDPQELFIPAEEDHTLTLVDLQPLDEHIEVDAKQQKLSERIWAALQISAEEFFEMGQYLILGSILAALMQTLIPQARLLAWGGDKFSSILIMIILAVVLSICSTVDAFIALSFVGTFTTGSILAFLVFGPMVDIKSTLLYLQVFNKKTVIFLITLPLLLTMLFGIIMNYYTVL